MAKKENQEVQKFQLTSRDKYVAKSLLPYFGFVFFVFSEAFFTMQASSIGIETVMIPLLFVVYTPTQTLTSYRLGIWIDKAGSRKIMLFAYICALAAQLLLYAKSPSATWIAYAFFGLFTVASLNAGRTFIAKEPVNKGSLYGVFCAGITLFGAAGAFVSGILWEHLGMDAVLLFSLSGTLLMLLLFLKTKRGNAYKS